MRLEGVITALVTPFKDSGDIDYDALERLIAYQFEKGAKGVVPCGSTGEYYAMTPDERADVLQFVAKLVGNRGILIAGTNGGSTREIIEHSRRARDLGYRAILLAPPYYSLPSQQELIAHYRSVIDAVDVELVLYNYPPRVGVEVGYEVLDALKDDRRVVGIKESSGNLLRAIEIKRRYGDSYQLSCGTDDQALDFFLWGATSWICGPANCFAVQANAVTKAFFSGDIPAAREEMRRMYTAMSSLETGKFVQKIKYGCELLGIPAGPPRRPLLPLSDEEKKSFRKAFEAAYA